MREVIIDGKTVFSRRVASLSWMMNVAKKYNRPAEIRVGGRTVWTNCL